MLLHEKIRHFSLIIETNNLNNLVVHHFDEPAVLHAEVTAVAASHAFRLELNRTPLAVNQYSVDNALNGIYEATA